MLRAMRRALFALPCLLAACGDPGGDYPALVPLEALLEPQVPAAAASPAAVTAEVQAAGAAARSRARAAGPVAADAELLARAAALRARAEALRQAEPEG